MTLIKDPESGLMLPRQFVDEKVALKKTIDDLVDQVVNEMNHIRENYFLTIHARFNKHDSGSFEITAPKVTFKLPPFLANTFVFWVSNAKGICELLWMTSKKDGKLKIDFNENGVAYLQAKGAMPS